MSTAEAGYVVFVAAEGLGFGVKSGYISGGLDHDYGTGDLLEFERTELLIDDLPHYLIRSHGLSPMSKPRDAVV